MAKFLTLLAGCAFLCLATCLRTSDGRTLREVEVWSIVGGKWDNDMCADWEPCYDGASECDFYSMYHGNCDQFFKEETQSGNSEICVPSPPGDYWCASDPNHPGEHVCLKKRQCKDAQIYDPETEEYTYVCIDDTSANWIDVRNAPDALLADDCY